MKISKAYTVLLILLFIALIINTVTIVTMSLWTESYSNDKTARIEVGEYNPSEKHIVFAALDSNENIITEGTAASYAAVGYTGLVAELEIPSTHNGLPVTAILVDPSNISSAFANNKIIQSIIIPLSVTNIAGGAFANITNLTEITISGDPEAENPTIITIGDYAFMGTPKLTTLTFMGRSIVGEMTKIFFQSGYDYQSK